MSNFSTVRPGRGRSIIDFPDEYVVVDIETTGLSPEYCEIIEISAIKYHREEVLGIFSTLVKPKYPIDWFITELTGITNEMVEDAPPVSEAVLDFYKFIGEDIIVGYNVSFDVNFLYDNLKRCHDMILSNPWLNIQRIAKKLVPNLGSYAQTSVASYYGLSTEGAHRATIDCEITHTLFELFKKEIARSAGGFQGFKDLFKHKQTYNPKSWHAKDIVTDKTEFDTTHPLYNKVCVFTGKLEKLSRKEAAQLVVDLGGQFEDNVTKKTNYLILGNLDYAKSIKDGKSTKYKKAEQLILAGQDLQILSEDVFYDLVYDEQN